MKKKSVIIGAAIIFVLAGVFWMTRQKNNTLWAEYPVTRGDLDIRILATGTVQPENRLEIKAPIAGRIDEVLIKEGTVVRKGQIIAWMSSTERAAMMDSARARGPEEVTRWEELYRRTPIISPLAGTIILRNVEPGQTITNSEAIFAMSDRLTVKAQVDETDIAKIQLKQKAEITLDAYPETQIPALVDQIAFEAKTVNNVTTYLVDVLPTSTPEFMRAGMTANVNFHLASKKDVLLLPSEALRLIDGKSTVAITVNGTVEDREVTVGLSDGKKSEVLAGLKEGDVALRAELNSAASGSKNPFSPFGNSRRPGSGGSRRKN